MIRKININETRQHVGIQTLSTVVMWYPLQKKHAVLRGIIVQRCSRLPIGKSQRQEVQHLKLTMGEGCHCVFVGTRVSFGEICLSSFVLLVLYCFLFFVLFSLFCFVCSFSGSLQWTIYCLLTTTTSFILLYLPWWKLVTCEGLTFHVQKTSLFKSFSGYFIGATKISIVLSIILCCLLGILIMVYEMIPYVWIPSGFI